MKCDLTNATEPTSSIARCFTLCRRSEEGKPSFPQNARMTHMPRLLPQPIPAIHPLAEYAVEGRRKVLYEDMKRTLRVPWMGVVTMAYAHYPNFFDTLWQGLKPLVQSAAFVEQTQTLRRFTEDAVAALKAPPLRSRLQALGYAPRELAQVEETIEVFSHGNFPYLLIATLTRFLLEGGQMQGGVDTRLFINPIAPQAHAPLVLMEPHHVDAPTRVLYEDIKTTLGLPFVNTDYRALARWPSYFSLALGDLKPSVGGAVHEAICAAVHEQAVNAVRLVLPNPGGLDSARLLEAAARDVTTAEVVQMSRLFQWLLPGLVTNVAFFREQLSV